MLNKIKQYIDTELEVAALGVFAVAFLETVALIKGVDGVMFGATMTCIGVIIGWVFKAHQVKK